MSVLILGIYCEDVLLRLLFGMVLLFVLTIYSAGSDASTISSMFFRVLYVVNNL